jgi:hypothetical protein
MQQVFNRKLVFLGLLFTGFFWANLIKAVCPICVVAVGAGLGLSRWLGVDDVVSSIWIGALLAAMVLWTLIWFEKRKWVFPFDKAVVILAYYLLTFVPLYYAGILGHPLNKILGTDKIIFGITIGSVAFMLSHWFNLYLKQKNHGKVFFNYQKVVIPVVILLITSLTFYLLILWKII